MSHNRFQALSLLVVLLVVSQYSQSVFAQQNKGKPLGVFVAPVAQTEFADTVEALGTLRARNNVELAATVTELVTEVKFTDGQRVVKGDVLVQMDDSEQQALLAEERARLLEAQRNVKRFEPLTDRGAASEAVLDQSQALLSAAQARIKAIETRIAQRQIVAPFDGVLGLRNISVGALAQPGTIITTIDDDGIMKLDFSIPELFLGDLKVGNKISATADAFPGREYQGTLASLDSRVDPVTRSLTVRALLDNADLSLKPGLLMRVKLSRNPRIALVVQEEAVLSDGKKKFIFVVFASDSGQTAVKREVQLGARRAGEVEIKSGVAAGEQFVIHGVQRLRDGEEISILAVEKGGETLEQLLNSQAAVQ